MNGKEIRHRILQAIDKLHVKEWSFPDDNSIADELLYHQIPITLDEVRGHLGILADEGKIKLNRTMHGRSAGFDPTQRLKFRESIENESVPNDGKEKGMDVLISWSKTQSRELATALYQWIPQVLPGVKPWMSDKDIDKGTDWWNELQGFLAKTKMCIICVTKENVRSPWLYYETGAIAVKGDGVRVCPYLIGIEPNMLADGPLSKWQCTKAEKEDTLSLIRSLNRTLAVAHHEDLLKGNFEARWPEFDSSLTRILAKDITTQADFIETTVDQLAGKQLTPEARTLLLEAVLDPNGWVQFIRSDSGGFLLTNNRPFGNNGPRDLAAWKKAAEDLVEQGLFNSNSNKPGGISYSVTHKGFQIADLLK